MAIQTNQYGQTYSGNDDFRGWLAANPNQQYDFTTPDGSYAQSVTSGALLNYVGNDGNTSSNDSAIRNATNAAYQAYNSARTPTGLNNYTATQAAQQTAAAQASAYNQQAQQYQDQYNALDGQYGVGQSNIDNSYKSSLNTLNDNNAVALRDYNNQVGQNTQSFLGTKNGIQTNTRQSANSLQRLLGLNGAGNSSAALEAAPYAAALQGSQQLNGAQTTYAQNQSNLDTSWDDTKRAYDQKIKDLDQNKFAQQQNLQSQITQQRINLLNQISAAKTQAGDTSGNAQRAQQVKDFLAALTGYGNQYAQPVTVNTDLNYASPTLGSYTLGKQAIASNGQSGAAADIATPFLSVLANNKRDMYGNVLA